MSPVQVTLIGAPMDLGAGRRGVDMGPSAIRHAGLGALLQRLGHDVRDAGDVFSPVAEALEVKDEALRYVDEILESCAALADRVEQAASAGRVPVVLGGDHSIALGTIAGLCRVARRVGVVYFDAHGDFNTPATSPSGNIHGMPLSAACGFGHPRLTSFGPRQPMLRVEDVALVGLRDVDLEEARLIRESGVHAFTLREIDERGMVHVVGDAIAAAAEGTDWLHVSFDMDSIDPRFAPGTGTPVEGGLTWREAHLAMEMLSDTGLVRSLEVVEVNPILDEGNRTGRLAAELAASCFGKRIL